MRICTFVLWRHGRKPQFILVFFFSFHLSMWARIHVALARNEKPTTFPLQGQVTRIRPSCFVPRFSLLSECHEIRDNIFLHPYLYLTNQQFPLTSSQIATFLFVYTRGASGTCANQKNISHVSNTRHKSKDYLSRESKRWSEINAFDQQCKRLDELSSFAYFCSALGSKMQSDMRCQDAVAISALKCN